MTDSVPLTDLQIELMRVLWLQGEATVIEVHQRISQQRGLAQGTVATLLTRLEKRGAITHRTEGRQFVYRALVSETEVRRWMLAQVADRLFGGDVPLLIHQLLAEREVSAGDLAEVKALIAERESTDRKETGK
ncbi:MAG: BlaI/MecI/CopY family transcriptional regulator [Gemmatimonadota bacterium]|nr:BlaI/MecI/CopY family transcriptional regulator [Gemmatimonadota bacterium]